MLVFDYMIRLYNQDVSGRDRAAPTVAESATESRLIDPITGELLTRD
jgi:hypothetical protein